MPLAAVMQASATLSDGRVFLIGGSWSGGTGNKNGEVRSRICGPGPLAGTNCLEAFTQRKGALTPLCFRRKLTAPLGSRSGLTLCLPASRITACCCRQVPAPADFVLSSLNCAHPLLVPRMHPAAVCSRGARQSITVTESLGDAEAWTPADPGGSVYARCRSGPLPRAGRLSPAAPWRRC